MLGIVQTSIVDVSPESLPEPIVPDHSCVASYRCLLERQFVGGRGSDALNGYVGVNWK